MEELLALYGIKSVVYFDNQDVPRTYAFTADMASKDIFIEFYKAGEGKDDDDDEDEDGEISFEEQEDEDDDEIPDHGGQLSVIMEHGKKYYQFLMYHGTYEISVPVIQIQTILFLVKLIEQAPLDRLVDYLTTASKDPLIPHLIEDKEHRALAVKLVKTRIQTIHELIRADKAGLN